MGGSGAAAYTKPRSVLGYEDCSACIIPATSGHTSRCTCSSGRTLEGMSQRQTCAGSTHLPARPPGEEDEERRAGGQVRAECGGSSGVCPGEEAEAGDRGRASVIASVAAQLQAIGDDWSQRRAPCRRISPPTPPQTYGNGGTCRADDAREQARRG